MFKNFLMVVNKKEEKEGKCCSTEKMRSNKRRRMIVLGNPYFAVYVIFIDSNQRSSMAIKILWFHRVKYTKIKIEPMNLPTDHLLTERRQVLCKGKDDS